MNHDTAQRLAHIRQSIDKVAAHLEAHPQDALSPDSTAVATLEGGLRCRATGPNGAVMVSDMPVAVGGGGTAPSAGWLLRAALANCDASVIALRAAQLGILLTALQVTVDSDSDERGILGLSDDAPPGPLRVRVAIRLAASNASDAQLRELVHWAEAHSPVGDALRRSVPVETQVVVG